MTVPAARFSELKTPRPLFNELSIYKQGLNHNGIFGNEFLWRSVQMQFIKASL